MGLSSLCLFVQDLRESGPPRHVAAMQREETGGSFLGPSWGLYTVSRIIELLALCQEQKEAAKHRETSLNPPS